MSTTQTCFSVRTACGKGHYQISLEFSWQGINLCTDFYCHTSLTHRTSCKFHLNYNIINCIETIQMPVNNDIYSHCRSNLRSSSMIVAVLELVPSMAGGLVESMDTIKSWSPSTFTSSTAVITAVRTVPLPDPIANVTVSGPSGS